MGTWTVTELAESRSYSLSYPGQESFLDLVFLVRWTPASSGDPYPGDQELYDASGLPMVKKRLPSGVYGTDSLLKSFVCRGVSLEILRDAPYSWRATCRFSTFGYFGDDQGRYVQVQRQASLRNAQTWRMNAAMAYNSVSASTGIGTADIGGDKVDLNGNPQTYDVPQMQISMEYLWDRTAPAGSPAGEPPTSTWATYIGKRNNAAYIGCARGTLVYQGFTVSPSYEWYRIQHQFLWDAHFHLEQFPLPIPTGAPRCLPGATIAGLVVLQCEKVGFFQRYPGEANFDNILPDAASLAELTAPKPTFP